MVRGKAGRLETELVPVGKPSEPKRSKRELARSGYCPNGRTIFVFLSIVNSSPGLTQFSPPPNPTPLSLLLEKKPTPSFRSTSPTRHPPHIFPAAILPHPHPPISL